MDVSIFFWVVRARYVFIYLVYSMPLQPEIARAMVQIAEPFPNTLRYRDCDIYSHQLWFPTVFLPTCSW